MSYIRSLIHKLSIDFLEDQKLWAKILTQFAFRSGFYVCVYVLVYNSKQGKLSLSNRIFFCTEANWFL